MCMEIIYIYICSCNGISYFKNNNKHPFREVNDEFFHETGRDDLYNEISSSQNFIKKFKQ